MEANEKAVAPEGNLVSLRNRVKRFAELKKMLSEMGCRQVSLHEVVANLWGLYPGADLGLTKGQRQHCCTGNYEDLGLFDARAEKPKNFVCGISRGYRSWRMVCEKDECYKHAAVFGETKTVWDDRSGGVDIAAFSAHLVPLDSPECPVITNDGLAMVEKLTVFGNMIKLFVVEKCMMATRANVDPALVLQIRSEGSWWLLDIWDCLRGFVHSQRSGEGYVLNTKILEG